MGTHPIFESDFDCLTENVRYSRPCLLYHQPGGFMPVLSLSYMSQFDKCENNVLLVFVDWRNRFDDYVLEWG